MAKPQEDYYATLGVSSSATADEIKGAYRKLAVQLHPDLGGDPHEFQELGEAYGILSDPEKRSAYDSQKSNRLVENLQEAASGVVEEFFQSISTP